jgi:hypothetical protein
MVGPHLDKDGSVITKRGKPVGTTPPDEPDCTDPIGSLKGKLRVKGDTMSVPFLIRDKRILKSRQVPLA